MKGNEQIQKQQQRQTPTPQLYIYSICTVYAQILCWYTVTTNVYLDTVWLADGHWAGTCLYTGKDLLLFNTVGLSPSSSESLSTRGGTRTRIFCLSLCTTSFSFPRDFSISFPASLRERFSVTVPLIWGKRTQARSEHGKILLHVDSRTVQFLMGKVETGSIGAIEP